MLLDDSPEFVNLEGIIKKILFEVVVLALVDIIRRCSRAGGGLLVDGRGEPGPGQELEY